MSEADEEMKDRRGQADSFMVALATVLCISLPLLGLVPQQEAILVGWTIAFLVGYFIPPRPQMKFVPWMLERVILIGCFYLAVFKIPLLLKRSLMTPFAYGIPIVLFVAGYIAWIRHPKSSLRPGRA
jgi:hypothetical protein